MMFGYATNETPELMPMPISLAHQLAKRLAEVRKNGLVPYLRPDGKTQVTVRYVDGRPVAIEKVADLDPARRRHRLRDADQARPVGARRSSRCCPGRHVRRGGARCAHFLVNPTGRFVIGGPMGDCGLTGRKIIVDTYGGMARHGGGAFSGKDPTKVDRSAAYAARWVAKNVVAAGLADRAEVQVAYAIGVAHPVSVMVETLRHRAHRPRPHRRARRRALRPAPGRVPRGAAACTGRSTRRRPPTATSAATIRTSPGSAPTAPPCCAQRPASALRPPPRCRHDRAPMPWA